MSDTPSLQSILDPSHSLAYLAYLPSSLAYEVTITVYVYVSLISVLTWDILNNLSDDYKILVKRRISIPNIVYCISRIFTLAYFLETLIYETAPIGHCERLSKVGPGLVCIAISSTSLLFYFRVVAIYNHHKYVSAFFFLMWLGMLGGSFMDIVGEAEYDVIGVAGHTIGPTKHCLIGTPKTYASVGPVLQFVNDSLIVVAITLRLMQIGMEEEMKVKDVFRIIIFGRNLPAFTRALLRDGQAYYLTISTALLIDIVIFYIDSIPPFYRTIFSFGCVALFNIMACRVYRKTKLGQYRENTTIELPLSFARTARAEKSNALGLAELRTVETRSPAVFVVSTDPVESWSEPEVPLERRYTIGLDSRDFRKMAS